MARTLEGLLDEAYDHAKNNEVAEGWRCIGEFRAQLNGQEIPRSLIGKHGQAIRQLRVAPLAAR